MLPVSNNSKLGVFWDANVHFLLFFHILQSVHACIYLYLSIATPCVNSVFIYTKIKYLG